MVNRVGYSPCTLECTVVIHLLIKHQICCHLCLVCIFFIVVSVMRITSSSASFFPSCSCGHESYFIQFCLQHELLLLFILVWKTCTVCGYACLFIWHSCTWYSGFQIKKYVVFHFLGKCVLIHWFSWQNWIFFPQYCYYTDKIVFF